MIDHASVTLSERLHELWHQLYEKHSRYAESLKDLEALIQIIEESRDKVQKGYAEKDSTYHNKPTAWYQKSVFYSAYTDLYNSDFSGLIERLPQLQELGVNALWLLPAFPSPMKDMGFDISDYFEIRRNILPRSVRDRDVETKMKYMRDFMAKAHEHGIDVLFDVALNHTSDQHEWFQEEINSVRLGGTIDEEVTRYIWSDTKDKYKDAPIIFSDVETSNWLQVEEEPKRYYFHTFYRYQPDLNYRNPKVLADITSMFVYWLTNGIDGFRMDAIPHIIKTEGTTCVNRPEVHIVLKFLRCALEYVTNNVLILAEANLEPKELVTYFGNDDECTACYNFPLTARVYQSMAIQSFEPIREALSKAVTPDIPPKSAWFFFLRCHDEMNLALFSEDERKKMFAFYCHDEKWQFRQHLGISARVADLLLYNPGWINMANSILLTVNGTPIIYYGDEYAKKIDEKYYEEKLKETGIVDTRNYCRGRIDWASVDQELKRSDTLCFQVYNHLKKMLSVRRAFPWLGSARSVQVLELVNSDDLIMQNVLAYVRTDGRDSLMFIHNMSDKPCEFKLPEKMQQLRGTDLVDVTDGAKDLLGQEIDFVDEQKTTVRLTGYNHLWLRKATGYKLLVVQGDE